MKISKRIICIEQLILNHYQHIWDCCCDHGFLGARLLESKRAPHIHFVDIIPEIMTKLTQQLGHFYPPGLPMNSTWHVHCQDVATIELQQYPNDSHLAVIAGVGGELTAHLVTQISQAHPHINIEFLLCPVNHTFKLRQTLEQIKMGLISEMLFEEKQRFYEIIHVSQRAKDQISATGFNRWQADKTMHIQYLTKLLNHYEKSRQHSQSDHQAFLAYQTLYDQLNNAL